MKFPILLRNTHNKEIKKITESKDFWHETAKTNMDRYWATLDKYERLKVKVSKFVKDCDNG